MSRHRVVVLCHEDLVPPDSIEGLSESEVDRIGRALLAKGLPDGSWVREKRIVHAVFVPELQSPPRRAAGRRPYRVITGTDVLECLR